MSKATRLPTLVLLFAFTAFPALVKSYNCKFAGASCDGLDNIVDYSRCLVASFSISLFIQCADLNNAASINSDQQQSPLTPLEVLTNAVSIPACNQCALNLGNIRNKWLNTANAGPFGQFLCHNYQPTDQNICCLSSGVKNGEPVDTSEKEHSIAAYCKDGSNADLMAETAIICAGTTTTGGAAASSSDAVDVDPTPIATGDTPAATSAAGSSTSSGSSTATSTSASNAPSPTAQASKSSTTGEASRWRAGAFGLVAALAGGLVATMLTFS